jgi:GxxExxY protein
MRVWRRQYCSTRPRGKEEDIEPFYHGGHGEHGEERIESFDRFRIEVFVNACMEHESGSLEVGHLLHAELTGQVIAAAVEVHRELGPGLLESAYQACLCHELATRRIDFRTEVALPVDYKGIHLDCGYRMDLVVAEKIAVELKSIDKILPIHQAQLLTYLRLSRMRVGLLINFNVPILRHGVIRRVL